MSDSLGSWATPYKISADAGATGPAGAAGAKGDKGDTGDAAPSTFIGLSDTPGAFTGQSGKILQVNDGATGLGFVDAPGGGGIY